MTKFDLGVETRRDKVDVMHLLWEVAGEIGFQAEMKGQSLTIERIELDTKVPGDELQLRQALRNLIGNAVKYTPAGGTITLSLEHESNMAKIKVQDTGYGIPASDLPHIFDFYRVVAMAMTRSKAGLGWRSQINHRDIKERLMYRASRAKVVALPSVCHARLGKNFQQPY
jgi:signal transduction histidine kinase